MASGPALSRFTENRSLARFPFLQTYGERRRTYWLSQTENYGNLLSDSRSPIFSFYCICMSIYISFFFLVFFAYFRINFSFL